MRSQMLKINPICLVLSFSIHHGIPCSIHYFHLQQDMVVIYLRQFLLTVHYQTDLLLHPHAALPQQILYHNLRLAPFSSFPPLLEGRVCWLGLDSEARGCSGGVGDIWITEFLSLVVDSPLVTITSPTIAG